jgi:hypothetical protein
MSFIVECSKKSIPESFKVRNNKGKAIVLYYTEFVNRDIIDYIDRKFKKNKSWETRIMFGKYISRQFLLMSDTESKAKYINKNYPCIPIYEWIRSIYTEIVSNLKINRNLQYAYCIKLYKNMQWNQSFLRLQKSSAILILTLGKSRYLYIKDSDTDNPKKFTIKLKNRSLVYISNPENILKSSLRTKSPGEQEEITYIIIYYII